uniref:Uncharacterized protein n=1 Tax=Romanomermis culicivorax TaxID=13658 RepID=A0A915ILJ6_ROMCU
FLFSFRRTHALTLEPIAQRQPRLRCPCYCYRRPKQPLIVIPIAPTLSHTAYCNHRLYLDKGKKFQRTTHDVGVGQFGLWPFIAA